MLKIELCAHHDHSGESVLATEYLNINDISNYENQFPFIPTFGPMPIDMYSQPNNLRQERRFSNEPNQFDDDRFETEDQEKEDNDLKNNTSTGEYISFSPLVANGALYVARVYLSIFSKTVTNIIAANTILSALPTNENDIMEKMQSKGGLDSIKIFKNKRAEFITFLLLDEVTLIDSRYQYCEICFQLTMGKNFMIIYNVINYWISKVDYSKGTEGYQNLGSTQKQSNKSETMKTLQLHNNMPIYLPYEKVKDCLCLNVLIEDTRYIMYKINFMKHNIKKLVNYLFEIS